MVVLLVGAAASPSPVDLLAVRAVKLLTSRFRSLAVRAVNSRETKGTSMELRLRKLKPLDEELRRGDEKAALSLVRDLQGRQPGGLRCFGAARQVKEMNSMRMKDEKLRRK